MRIRLLSFIPKGHKFRLSRQAAQLSFMLLAAFLQPGAGRCKNRTLANAARQPGLLCAYRRPADGGYTGCFRCRQCA